MILAKRPRIDKKAPALIECTGKRIIFQNNLQMTLVLNICFLFHLLCEIFIMGICLCIASNHDTCLYQKLQIDIDFYFFLYLLLTANDYLKGLDCERFQDWILAQAHYVEVK